MKRESYERYELAYYYIFHLVITQLYQVTQKQPCYSGFVHSYTVTITVHFLIPLFMVIHRLIIRTCTKHYVVTHNVRNAYKEKFQETLAKIVKKLSVLT